MNMQLEIKKYNSIGKLIIVFLLVVVSFLNGCDPLYLPSVKSGFKDVVTIVTVDSKGDVREFDLNPGISFVQREKGIEYRKISVYEKDDLIFEFNDDELKRLLSLVKDKYNVIWYIDEQGIQLIGKDGKKVGELKK